MGPCVPKLGRVEDELVPDLDLANAQPRYLGRRLLDLARIARDRVAERHRRRAALTELVALVRELRVKGLRGPAGGQRNDDHGDGDRGAEHSNPASRAWGSA